MEEGKIAAAWFEVRDWKKLIMYIRMRVLHLE
jgi:hypothetical protein